MVVMNLGLFIRRENGGDRGARRGIGVDKVGSGIRPAHGAGCPVVSQGGLLRGVEGAEPMPLFGGRVSNLRRVPSPWPPPHTKVPPSPCRFMLLLLLWCRRGAGSCCRGLLLLGLGGRR